MLMLVAAIHLRTINQFLKPVYLHKKQPIYYLYLNQYFSVDSVDASLLHLLHDCGNPVVAHRAHVVVRPGSVRVVGSEQIL